MQNTMLEKYGRYSINLMVVFDGDGSVHGAGYNYSELCELPDDVQKAFFKMFQRFANAEIQKNK